MDEESDRQFIANGRFAIDRLLGKGGAGAVYLAYDTTLARWVAIKRMPASDAMISREAKTMASFHHPNIVTMHDILLEGDETIFVMELVLGQTLEELVEPLSEDTFRNLAAQCLEGLGAAHEKNVVHRDIKPGNIMLAPLPEGGYQLKLLDFGQSRTIAEPSLQTMDQSGAVVGSIYMMSPEQLSHDALDHRTDFYSLGCVFYQALSLQRPFTGKNVPEVVASHLQHRFTPLKTLRPDLPESLTLWVEKLFSFDREERPANAHAALQSLKATTAPSKIDLLSTAPHHLAAIPAPSLKPIPVLAVPKAPILVAPAPLRQPAQPIQFAPKPAVAAIPLSAPTPVRVSQPVSVGLPEKNSPLFPNAPFSPLPNSLPSPPLLQKLPPKLWIAIGAAFAVLVAGIILGFTMFGSQFKPLIKPDFSNMQLKPGAWSFTGDTLEYSGKGDACWTKEQYRNFQMDFEVLLPKGGNSGVLFRSKNPQSNMADPATLELDMIDGDGAGTLIYHGNPKQPLNIADEKWHRFSILAKDNLITISHNGTELYTAELDDPKISKEGHIVFQGWLGNVKYRNIAIKKL